jgi:hypothetical protein
MAKHPEQLTREELISEIEELLAWSLAVGYYPGKLDSSEMKRLIALNNENEIRLGAQ